MENKQIFTDEGIANIVGFFETLLKIDRRLKKEGYKFKNGDFIPPKVKKAK
jgi:hypothetical protein